MRLLAISTRSFTASNRELYRRLKDQGLDVLLLIPQEWDFGNGKVKAEEIKPEDPTIHFLEASNFQALYPKRNQRSGQCI